MIFSIGVLLDRIAEHPEDSIFVRFLSYLTAIGFPLLVGFSRLYNGVHTMDQILYGLLLGLWLAISLHLLVRDFLLSHIKSLLKRTEQYTNGDLSKFYLISSLIAMALFVTLSLTFYIVDAEFSVPLDWKQRLLNKCKNSESPFMFGMSSLVQGGAVLILYGAYLGVLSLYESGNNFQSLDINDLCSTV